VRAVAGGGWVRRKPRIISGGERKIAGDVQGNCRKLQMAESILAFLGGQALQSFAFRYDSEE
jgi:hypothetical protein